jgi:hypothetical protein
MSDEDWEWAERGISPNDKREVTVKKSLRKELIGYIRESMRTKIIKDGVLDYLKNINAYEDNQEVEVKALIDKCLDEVRLSLEEME